MASEKEYFDDAAIRYGLDSVLVPGASRFRNAVLDKAMKKALTPFLKEFQRLNVLEVGCGVGRWTGIMAEENSVIGMDISPFMIKMAKNIHKNRSCSFIVADISFLPFIGNAFDYVVSITVLQHLLNEKKFSRALHEIARCSKYRALIVEEMWSTKEITFQNTYCPIRILPVKSYIRKLYVVGLRPLLFRGVTPSILSVKLTGFLASKTQYSEGRLITKVKSSKLLTEAIHFVLGACALSSVFAPFGSYNPYYSLHTALVAGKMNPNGI